jgi:hypothetical protein
VGIFPFKQRIYGENFGPATDQPAAVLVLMLRSFYCLFFRRGSYTNGAGLYRRSDLMSIGRMYGEPGDAFHDRYVESNYAYRAAMKHCHSALRLTDDRSCDSIFDPQCTGAFHHIGGGRGTRPMNTKGTTCDDLAWNFFGTPLYEKYHNFVGQKSGRPVETCSKEELEELRQRNFRDRGESIFTFSFY